MIFFSFENKMNIIGLLLATTHGICNCSHDIGGHSHNIQNLSHSIENHSHDM